MFWASTRSWWVRLATNGLPDMRRAPLDQLIRTLDRLPAITTWRSAQSSRSISALTLSMVTSSKTAPVASQVHPTRREQLHVTHLAPHVPAVGQTPAPGPLLGLVGVVLVHGEGGCLSHPAVHPVPADLPVVVLDRIEVLPLGERHVLAVIPDHGEQSVGSDPPRVVRGPKRLP